MKRTIPIASRSRLGGAGGGKGGGCAPHGGGPQVGGGGAAARGGSADGGGGCPSPTGVVGRGSLGSDGFMVGSGKHAVGGAATGKKKTGGPLSRAARLNFARAEVYLRRLNFSIRSPRRARPSPWRRRYSR
jgi:hypothetical protein